MMTIMKRTTLLILLFSVFSIYAQEKFTTNTATINFEASVPLFEEIKAVNRSAMVILEPKTSTFNCIVIIKDFRFELDMMQEHFNQNYLESDRYPKAVFKGKIAKFDMKDIDDIEKEYIIKGKLTVHGKSREIEVKALMKRVKEGIQIHSDFPILVSDFDISIPKKIGSKISSTANTGLSAVIRSEEMALLTLK
jgi:hypothetical protein